MASPQKPPRPWDIDDLRDLGRRGKKTYIKAVPVLILEEWVQGEREEEVANFVRTGKMVRRLQSSKLAPGFKAKGTGSVLGSLIRKQNGQNQYCPDTTRRAP